MVIWERFQIVNVHAKHCYLKQSEIVLIVRLLLWMSCDSEMASVV